MTKLMYTDVYSVFIAVQNIQWYVEDYVLRRKWETNLIHSLQVCQKGGKPIKFIVFASWHDGFI